MKKIKTLLFTILSLSFPKLAFAGEFDALVGEVEVPKGVGEMNAESGGIGVLLFFSKFIQFVTVVASIWVVLNVVLAGFTYITGGGKSDTHSKVRDRLTMSLMGLLIIVASYTVAGLIGLIFFGDATYILNPTIAPI